MTKPKSKNRISLWLLKFYKNAISPYLPRACRFEPSCSVYAKQCFERFSWPKAFWLSLKRLLRCHPFCEGGSDPAPQNQARTKTQTSDCEDQ